MYAMSRTVFAMYLWVYVLTWPFEGSSISQVARQKSLIRGYTSMAGFGTSWLSSAVKQTSHVAKFCGISFGTLDNSVVDAFESSGDSSSLMFFHHQ